MNIFHSETNGSVANIDPITALYDTLFNWVVFLGLPTLFTIKLAWPVLCNFDDKLSEHLLEALLSFLAAIGCLYLLSRHAPIRR